MLIILFTAPLYAWRTRLAHARAPRPESQGFVFDDATDDFEKKKKRSRNKNIERRRRAELSSDFQSLRSLIPGLETKEGATVRVILKKATNYCRSLTAEGEQQKLDLVTLKKEQKMLRRQITLLERQKRKNECVNK